jgi:hypothetical protein
MESTQEAFASSGEPQRSIDVSRDALTGAPSDACSKAEPIKALSQTQLPIDYRLAEVVHHPSIVLILGKRGSGKTAQGYRILELCRYMAQPYVVGLPGGAQDLLPEWIGCAGKLEDVPNNAIGLVDEAYLSYHSRGTASARSKVMSQMINLSRQRSQSIIFISQEARQIDKNIASSASVVIFKELGMLQVEFDRTELNKFARRAQEHLLKLTEDRRKWSYVYSSDADFEGLVQSCLPTFWKSSLSRAFARGPIEVTSRHPKKMTRGERIQKAKELFRQGLSYRQIAMTLSVTKGTAYNYVNGYPYQ